LICNEGPRSSLGNRDKGWKGSSINVEYIELDYTTPISHHTIHSRCAAHDLSRSMQMQEQRMTDDYSNSVKKTAFCPGCVHLYTHFRKAWFLLCKFPLFQVTEDSDVGHPSVLYLPPLRHTVSLLNKWEEFSFLFFQGSFLRGFCFFKDHKSKPFFK
jgi:hypothetical protein